MPAPLSRNAAPPRGQHGFTLVETMVGLAITAEILLVALLLFDVNSRIARNQVQVADMQQSQRIAHNELARMVRMAGRGGLHQLTAVVVQDDVAATDTVNGNAPVAGSDILTIRGVLTSPLYQIRPDSGTQVTYTPPGGGDTGSILIPSYSPTNIEQPLDPFDEIPITTGTSRPAALLLVSATSDAIFAVVEVTGISDSSGSRDFNGDGVDDRQIQVNFTKRATGNGLSAKFGQLNSTPGVFPPALNRSNAVAYAGILEEVRYYVRDDATALGGYAPKLTRAHFYPNTNIVLSKTNANDTSATWGRVDIAENVLDLQVALGRDTDGDGLISDAVDRQNDEWQLNDPDDRASDFDPGDPIFNVQLVTLVRTDRFDRGYTADPIDEIFNHVYNENTLPTTPAQRLERSYRRQLVTTTVDLRNVN
jgi:type II secretory pathway pseudopilin PulG